MAKDKTGSPDWPTAMRKRLADGRCIGVDGSVWLVRAVPMSPVGDARTPMLGLQASFPIETALDSLASMTQVRIARRNATRNTYRQVQILLVNVPQLYVPDADNPIAEYLTASFPHTAVQRRFVLLAVKLQDKVGGGGGLRQAVDSVTETLLSGNAPLSDYDQDTDDVGKALTAAGLRIPTEQEFRLANSWWNNGGPPDCRTMPHADHLHVFSTPDAARTAANLGAANCENWPVIADHHTLLFAAVQDFELPYVSLASHKAQWVSSFVDAGAVAVSIRGRVEPAKITRNELRRRKQQYVSDVNERMQAGKLERAEQEQLLAELSDIEAAYSTSEAPATLTDVSTIVVLSGRDARSGYDVDNFGSEATVLNRMVDRQDSALQEMFLCSQSRANPHLHDLPTSTVAASGLPSLSTVGDAGGALLGFTERDRQPAYILPTAAVDEDQVPIFIGVGQSGSGKTVTMLDIADQFARADFPVIIVDPKQESDHTAAVQRSGGQVYSLDSLAAADGVFDPIRFAGNSRVGVELASSMLLTINPFGPKREEFETPLIRALSFGVDNGAECIGQALLLAQQHGYAPKEMVDRVFAVADASPMVRAIVGVNPGQTPLRTASGITLIKVGSAYLDLGDASSQGTASLQQRVSLALVRMMVFGSSMALMGRRGVVMLDEGWVFLGAGRSEVERLGRLARSQGVLPMIWTQRVTDALEAGLSGYISRGLILPIKDESEAIAACELFKLEPTPERLARITAPDTLDGIDGRAPNWSSMRALRDPDTGQVLRGAVGIYADLAGQAIPVEITIPAGFLTAASTRPEDVRRRVAAEAAERASYETVAGYPPAQAPAAQPAPFGQQPQVPATVPAQVGGGDDGWGTDGWGTDW